MVHRPLSRTDKAELLARGDLTERETIDPVHSWSSLGKQHTSTSSQFYTDSRTKPAITTPKKQVTLTMLSCA